jgi:hypothetical protein
MATLTGGFGGKAGTSGLQFWSAERGGKFFMKGYGAAFELAFEAGVAEIVRGMAKECEQYAKENAPWEDQTGDARDGLTGQAQFTFTKYKIILYHTVDYGIWLEIRWDGKFAIIMPTIEVMGPKLMARIEMAEVLQAGALKGRI